MSVETYHSIRGGEFGITYVGGEIVDLVIPARYRDPAAGHELGEVLVELIRDGEEKHDAETLAEISGEASAEFHAVAQRAEQAVARARATLERSPMRARQFQEQLQADGEVFVGRSEEDRIVARFRDSSLVSLELSHEALTARGRDFLRWLRQAIADGRPTADLDLSTINEQVAEEAIRATYESIRRSKR